MGFVHFPSKTPFLGYFKEVQHFYASHSLFFIEKLNKDFSSNNLRFDQAFSPIALGFQYFFLFFLFAYLLYLLVHLSSRIPCLGKFSDFLHSCAFHSLFFHGDVKWSILSYNLKFYQPFSPIDLHFQYFFSLCLGFCLLFIQISIPWKIFRCSSLLYFSLFIFSLWSYTKASQVWWSIFFNCFGFSIFLLIFDDFTSKIVFPGNFSAFHRLFFIRHFSMVKSFETSLFSLHLISDLIKHFLRLTLIFSNSSSAFTSLFI